MHENHNAPREVAVLPTSGSFTKRVARLRASTKMTAGEDVRPLHRRRRGDDGAALVEFALVAPFLFLLIFGIVEFGWAFFQNLDVRHGARETARVAAVNFGVADPSCSAGGSGPCNDARLATIVAEACSRMDSGDDVTVHIMRTDGPDTNSSNYDIGDSAIVYIEKPLEQLTMFLDPFLNNIDLDSRVEIRLEQPAQWSAMPDANNDGRSESPLPC